MARNIIPFFKEGRNKEGRNFGRGGTNLWNSRPQPETKILTLGIRINKE